MKGPDSAAHDTREAPEMNRHEIAQELAHEDAQELLATAPLLRLAYNGPDGLPRVIPIGFHWNGEQIVVCTATTSPKARSLASRPEVAVTIDAGSTPAEAKSLLVRGVATLETVDGIPDEYIAGSRKSLEAEQVEAFERSVEAMYDQMVRISIEPRWARFFDFGAGRLPGFLATLARNAGAGENA
jgi:nitroimidazol reductase NimA-like FMN-containing flavoprotein (pyridoxamine 5'-phosphate oxidase superfamily)